MTTEVIAGFIITALIALVIGFLITHFILSKKTVNAENLLGNVQTELEKINTKHLELQTEHDGLQEQYHRLELTHNKLETMHQSQGDNLQVSEKQLRDAQEKLAKSTESQHSAENANHAAQAELQENKKQQQDLQERLTATVEELKDEREKLNQQKNQNAELDKKAKAIEVKAQETDTNYQDIKERLTKLQEKHDALQEKYTSLSSDHSELKTSLEERDQSHKKQLEQFEEQKQALSKEFENLANKIFEEKGKTFTDTSKDSIDTMLKPFREQIEGFQKRINNIHDESLKGNTNLNAEIKKVLDIGLKMSDEANNLTSALKGDSQKRGAWGEAQLKRTLEMSGLIEDAHYESQSSFKDLEGKQKQTDYIIKLPDNKHMIIDSKVSLVAYDKSISAATPEEHTLAMAEHIKAVKKHIDDLSSKDYTNLVGMRSPSFVLMFMPIEPAYIEALKNKKDLFNYGYSKGVVLVSHTTLIPILRTVANLWMMEKSNAEAREISEKAGDIYNQVCNVAERLQKLGGTLGTVSNHYNGTVTALVGQQGLHGKVERFKQLSSKVSKTMPSLEPTHIDFETERLTLAAEPIIEVEDHSSETQETIKETN